eukprot:gnl/MRDRNA2_/MRDRNA2_82642_c0_seq2.p1 gnl/MRDRNA2_/MRDRNA2_82642_c0~~gnl/MRDRNA2_/MRDRNA2_82642_c0_seq2.p1  ORF type:complete len:396 (+),score=54.44 gnl/MRDRNA2_/MRDRNA2_82642_c0_seq2:77-1264(+)
MQVTSFAHPRPQLRVKNTFLELSDEGSDGGSRRCRSGLPRSMSDSDLSSATPPGVEFLERASSYVSKGSSPSKSSTESGAVWPSDQAVSNDTPSGTSSLKLENDASQKCRLTMELCGKLAAVSQQQSGTRGVVLGTGDVSDHVTLQEVQQKLYESLKDLIPVDAEGQKMSMGSILHSQEPVATRCKPCYFWNKGRCIQGESCLRCHCPDHRPSNTERARIAIRRQKFFQLEDQCPSIGSPGFASPAKVSSDDGSNSNASLPVSGDTTPRCVAQEVREEPSWNALELYRRLSSLPAQGKHMPRAMVSSDDIVKLVPRDSQGDLTSIGTIPHYLHPMGEKCKPCVFWFQEVCHKGEMCLHCHVLHGGQKVKRIRASKATRALRNNGQWNNGNSKVSL